SGGNTQFGLENGADISTNVVLNAPIGGFLDWAQIRRVDASGDTPTIRGDISGRGEIINSYDLAGRLSPGLPDRSVDRLVTNGGQIRLASTTVVDIDAAGASDGEFDRISGSSSFVLDGALDVDFVDGYVPEPRDQFEVITGSAIDGFFSDIDIEPVGAIGPAHIVYTGNSVIIVICAADRDADGELTVFDFLAFQNLFAAGDLRADLDQDGQLTIFDFLVFQNRFSAGCP
ncbi:MAG: GC-type dockerin domain-anchored protein, partial [Phycisphaerales bacterium]